MLGATAAAGISSLAGCAWVNDLQESSDQSPSATRNRTQSSGPPPESSGPLQGLRGYRVGSSFADGGSGTPNDPWVLNDDVLAEPGRVMLDAGSFTTPSSGLSTASDIDYERWSVWLQGAGVRTTALQKAPGSDQHMLSFTSDQKGNFGGASGMGLFGSYPDGSETAGHLLHANGNIFDLLFSNLIVRYGWRDGIRIEPSASGTRIRNCWIENNGGWAVNLGGGTRAKLSNLHVISSRQGGINFRTSTSQLSNTSFYNCGPSLRLDSTDSAVANCYVTIPDGGIAIDELASCRSNTFTNVSTFETSIAVRAAGNESSYSNMNLRWTTGPAMRIPGDDVTVTGLDVVNVGSAQGGLPAVDITGNGVRVTGMSVAQKASPFKGNYRLARIAGDGVVLSDVNAKGGPWGVTIDAATEAVLDNVRGLDRSKVRDRGTRTLINGDGTNAGDPRSGGEWNGHGGYAHSMGATVWDVTTTPWTPYRADGDGNWLAV